MKIKNVVALINKSKAVYLSTVNSEGFPEVRALLNLANPKSYPKLKDLALVCDEDGETVSVYFTTNTSSRKTAQMRENSKSALYFCEPESFTGACLTGFVEEITDSAVKESFWQPGWTIYYHGGVTDPDYALFKFTSKSIHCWSGFGLHNFGTPLP